MNELYTYTLIKEKKQLYWKWLKNTRKTSWENMKESMLFYLDMIEKNKLEKIIVNEQDLNFIWIPNYQKWVDDNISHKLLECRILKLAIIKSEDIFQSVSLEQLIAEELTSKLNYKTFYNLSDAERWMNETES